ncbi:MAG: ERF family protein [Deltaproteobacteria bacterium]|nr:ERF family protein [Deltaproteobacteria bacterium]
MTKTVVVKPTNEVAESQSLAQSIVAMAANPEVDADKLAKLMELGQQFEANEARKAWHSAMARFKENPPKIDKDSTVDFTSSKGRTHYKHASIGNVTEKIAPALAAHGLSAIWKTEQKDGGMIHVTCILSHALGHCEETTMFAAADTSGNKGGIQALGSTISYLERYTILSICGLATHNDDNDGVDSEPISAQQHSTLVDLMAAHVADEKRFLEFWNIGDMSELWASNFDKACKMIKDKPKR